MNAYASISALAERLHAQEAVRAVVVGAGRSGRAAAELLLTRGAQVILTDDRPEALGNLPAGARGAPLSREAVDEADLVVLSPGVPRGRAELAQAIAESRLVGEVELGSWFIDLPMVAITGTNGKSTTTTLIGAILTKAGFRPFVGGNLGSPLSELARGLHRADVAVVELSSYQLESIETARWRVGVWLNLQADHLDRYPNLEVYAQAKARVFSRLEPEGAAVASWDDPVVRTAAESTDARIRWFSTQTTLEERGTAAAGGVARRADELYRLDGPGLIGRHNHENAVAAIEAARLMGADPRAVQAAISAFCGLPHRLSLVHEADGVVWYDDSKATNVASAVTAVQAMTRPTLLIAGGKDKGGAWSPLVSAARHRVERVLAIGEAAPIVDRAFSEEGIVVEVVHTLDQAVARAKTIARPGQAVLLAPACASFDQFPSYVARGQSFARLARDEEQRFG